MSANEQFYSANNYITLSENETSIMIKMDYRTLNQSIASWSYNREIMPDIVENLYDNIKDPSNNIIWILTAVKEKSNNELYLIDGQHRYEAIKKLMLNDIEFREERFVYIMVYLINNINEDDEYIIDLFTKINNNAPFNIPDFPSRRNIKIIKKIIKDKILKNGISTDEKRMRANQPKIHRKTLHTILNKYNDYIKDIDEDIIIQNLKTINNYISLKNYLEIFTISDENEKDANKNAWEKAKKLKFYLGFTKCNEKYIIDNIIKNISNPDLFI
jgi:hypothetical protein